MFSTFTEDLRRRRRQKELTLKERRTARRHVMYLADKVNLAVFHKRPAAEIELRLERLRAAVAGR